LCFEQDNPLAQTLQTMTEPFVVEALRRQPYGREAARPPPCCARWMARSPSAFAPRAKLRGVMVLGPRMAGRIFAAPELDAVIILSNHWGSPSTMPKLYTESQNSPHL